MWTREGLDATVSEVLPVAASSLDLLFPKTKDSLNELEFYF